MDIDQYLYGPDYEDVVTDLKKRCPDQDVYAVPQGAILTCDFDPKRIRVFYDERTRQVVSVREG